LLDDDTVLSNAGEGVAAVCDTRDGTSGARDSLDADTVVAVDDLVVGEVNVADSVVVTAANGADGKTVTASAGAAGEGDVSYTKLLVASSKKERESQILTARVDGNTIILVVNDSVGDGNTGRASDIEGICFMSENCSQLC
jgi:hypothetical protein